MTRILLVRHGQSEWNALGRWQGQADPPLSELGRQQAFSASRRIGTVDAIVSSDLQRAMETAQIISGQLGVGPVMVEPLFRERDAGEWSGLTREEIDEQYPGYLEERRRPPGYEPDDSLLDRTHEALGRVEEEFRGGEILVVAHGGLVYALEKEHGHEFDRLPNLGARWLTHDGSRIVLGDRIVLVEGDEITSVPAQI
jgi:broad specificity phosphatase PhoE